MSEIYTSVKPWEWLQVCEFWPDKVEMYLQAKSEVQPEIDKRMQERAKRQA